MTEPPSSKPPLYRKVVEWVQQYGSSGQSDQRAVQDFMTCETSEVVRSLQAELIAISQGKYVEENFDKVVGPNRRVRHGSYQAWAQAMLLWISAYKG